MSKTGMYGGYGYISVNNNIDEDYERKELLKKLFIEANKHQNKTNSTLQIREPINTPPTKFTTKKQKNRTSSDMVHQEDEKSKYNDIRKEKKQLEKALEKSKRLRFENMETIKSKDTEINNLRSAINELKLLHEKSLSANKFLDKELIKLQKSAPHSRLKKLTRENSILKKSLGETRKKLRNAVQKAQDYKLLRTGDLENAELVRLKKRVTSLENEILNLKEKESASMSTIGRLNNTLLNKRKKSLRQKEILHTGKAPLNKEVDADIFFGYISLNTQGQIRVVDLNGANHKISLSNNIDRLKAFLGMPVRVIRENETDTVKVDNIYYTIPSKTCVRRLYSANGFKIRESKKDVFVKPDEFKNLKILIVGARNKVKYKDALNGSGASVKWYDSFEENEERLACIASSSDVVILCTSHLSHSSLYKLSTLHDYNIENVKYQRIERDNTSNIINRVRFFIENTH